MSEALPVKNKPVSYVPGASPSVTGAAGSSAAPRSASVKYAALVTETKLVIPPAGANTVLYKPDARPSESSKTAGKAVPYQSAGTAAGAAQTGKSVAYNAGGSAANSQGANAASQYRSLRYSSVPEKPAPVPAAGQGTLRYDPNSLNGIADTKSAAGLPGATAGVLSADALKPLLTGEDYMLSDFGAEIAAYVKSLPKAEGEQIFAAYAERKTDGMVIGWAAKAGNGSFQYPSPGGQSTLLLDPDFRSRPRDAISQALARNSTEFVSYEARFTELAKDSDLDSYGGSKKGSDPANYIGMAFLDAWLGPDFPKAVQASSASGVTQYAAPATPASGSDAEAAKTANSNKAKLARSLGILVKNDWRVVFSNTVPAEGIDINLGTRTVLVSDYYQTRSSRLMINLQTALDQKIYFSKADNTVGGLYYIGYKEESLGRAYINSNNMPDLAAAVPVFKYDEIRGTLLLGLGKQYADSLGFYLREYDGQAMRPAEQYFYLFLNEAKKRDGIIPAVQWNSEDKETNYYIAASKGVVLLNPKLKSATPADIWTEIDAATHYKNGTIKTLADAIKIS